MLVKLFLMVLKCHDFPAVTESTSVCTRLLPSIDQFTLSGDEEPSGAYFLDVQ